MLGFHISKTAGPSKIKREDFNGALIADLQWANGISSLKVNAAQIFVCGPQNYKQIISKYDISQLKHLIMTNSIWLVIHGAYVDYIWNGSKPAMTNLRRELIIARQLCASGVIIHLGKNAPDMAAGICADLNLDHKSSPILWLEINAAKPGLGTYETSDKISALFDNIPIKYNVGLCVDTAHLWSCGVSLGTPDTALRWFKATRAAISPRPMMIHLNDSSAAFASGVDRHAPLCKGNIWKTKHGPRAISTILKWAHREFIPIILERASDDLRHDIMLISEL
jgi:deoxyribonuclease IV